MPRHFPVMFQSERPWQEYMILGSQNFKGNPSQIWRLSAYACTPWRAKVVMYDLHGIIELLPKIENAVLKLIDGVQDPVDFYLPRGSSSSLAFDCVTLTTYLGSMQLASWLCCRSGKRPDWLRFDMGRTVGLGFNHNVGWARRVRPSQLAGPFQYSKISLPFRSDMPDNHLPTTGISSRRSACDRCRTQKSKCLRERPDQVRCDRCHHADSECVTSPIYRMRAWKGTSSDSSGSSALPVSQHHERTKKRQRHGYDYQQLLTPSEPNSANVSGEIPSADAAPYFEDIAFCSSDYSCAQQPLAGPLQDQVPENTGLYDSIFGDVMDQYVDGIGYSSGDPFE